MQTTENLARSFGTSPFEIMSASFDDVVLFINYLLDKEDTKASEVSGGRLNDNFWDF